jgi:hypothetical protein
MATDYTQWTPEALAQIIAFREKSMEQFAERIEKLEAQATAAEGLAEALNLAHPYVINEKMDAYQQGLVDREKEADRRLTIINAALTAYAQSKGE